MDVVTIIDKEKLKQLIANRLLKVYAKQYKDDEAWAWQQVRNAVTDSTAAEKREIIVSLENTSIVRRAINTAAQAEAEMIVADDVLTLEELARILEDN